MNWLAHLFLSPNDVEFRIGNVVADWVKGEARQQFNLGIRRGIACHVDIDLFTDQHPIVLHSQSLIQPPYRRFAGVLVDVFYDHFLASDWTHYCEQPLSQWVRSLYEQIHAYPGRLEPRLRMGLERMASDDWLGSYRTVEGIDVIVRRMSQRLSRPTVLGEAAPQLQAHYEPLRADFHAYFPQLQVHVAEWITTHH